MGTDKNPKRMTDLELRAERVRLKREIRQLEKVKNQLAVADEIGRKKKRRLLLKDEIIHRHHEREIRQQAEVHISTQVEVADQPDLFMTADGDPYRP